MIDLTNFRPKVFGFFGKILSLNPFPLSFTVKLLSSKYDSKIIRSNYLPKVSFSGSYNQNRNVDEDRSDYTYNYGLNLSLPIDHRANRKIESTKLNILLSKLEYKKNIIAERNFFKNKINKINTIAKKIENKNKNIKSYEKVYEMTKSLFENTLKTENDVTTSLNRVKTSVLELDILKIEQQINIYDLYKKLIK